ncbi:MerR family transcriptional regulator [Proteiniclasticum sp.]|uniref:MerR family transcriptional regulator n=1 Tax=Proteiniclasticum sp. TaxID=2053595 RepID=UPI0028981324|nr:MerR family transcriptional regulator [Proteiniclasticum sp.]
MKIKEMESRSGIDRATIRYYEKEGLFEPLRTDNGYREYSEKDLELLMKIKLLRSLHVTLDDIKSLIKGKTSLRDTVSSQTKFLDSEEENITYAKEMCRTIYKNEMNFEQLDAEKYLSEINRSAEESGSKYFQVKEELPMVYDPWRRFLARGFDLALYLTLWHAVLVKIFHVNVGERIGLIGYLDLIVIIIMMILIEPVLLHFFRTTPGKAIFGLRIENADENRLTYIEAFNRTWGVALKGLGLAIPLVSFITYWTSYDRMKNGEIQPWDEGISYRIKDRKIYRFVVFGLANVLLILVFSFVEFSYYVPPHKGDLTVEEFSENFNHYAKIYDMDFGNLYLDKNGSWQEIVKYDHRTSLLPDYLLPPVVRFRQKDGLVTGISFVVEVEETDLWIESNRNFMMLSSLALKGKNQSILQTDSDQAIIDEIWRKPFESFAIEAGGLLITNRIENSGYYDGHDYMRMDRGYDDYYFRQEFSVTITE